MALSGKSLQFIAENHKQNSREWFVEHKGEYEKHVKAPMQELAESLIPTLVKIDPLLTLDPKRAVCRIYRDTRFSRDKTMFKRASWFVFQRSRGMVHPVWFFEFTPDWHHYGCGYYSTPTKVMERIRELVLAGDKRYLAAQKALDGLRGFSLEGDLYKRPHYPDAAKKERDWLERRSITALHYSEDKKKLFSKNLGAVLAEAFRKLAPVYSFLIDAHEAAEAKAMPQRRYPEDDWE